MDVFFIQLAIYLLRQIRRRSNYDERIVRGIPLFLKSWHGLIRCKGDTSLQRSSPPIALVVLNLVVLNLVVPQKHRFSVIPILNALIPPKSLERFL